MARDSGNRGWADGEHFPSGRGEDRGALDLIQAVPVTAAHPLSAALERELADRFAPSDRRTAHVMLSQYGLTRRERDVEHVRHAMLALSGGSLPRLGYYLAAAQRDYRDVLYWAQHPDQAPQR